MCYNPRHCKAEDVLNNVLHPQYVWSQAQMSSAVRKFYNSHADPLTIIAINTLRLFEVPVIGGIPDYAGWYSRTNNRELVIYLACTPTPIPFTHRFKQLDVVSIRVEEVPTKQEDCHIATLFMCIALVAPEVNGHREQVGTNWQFHVEFSLEQVGWLTESPIGILEAHVRLNRSIIYSRTI